MEDGFFEKHCPECGKKFTVSYPTLYVYKTGKRFYCSYTCFHAEDKRKEDSRMKMTPEDKNKVIEIAIKGGDPLQYLADHGSVNPAAAWYKIKAELKDSDPEKAEKLPKRIKVDKGMPKQLDLEGGVDYTVKVAETPEEPKKIVKPVNYDGFEMIGVRSKETGFRYEYSQEYKMFHVTVGVDSMDLHVSDWKKLLDELQRVIPMLGVEI